MRGHNSYYTTEINEHGIYSHDATRSVTTWAWDVDIIFDSSSTRSGSPGQRYPLDWRSKRIKHATSHRVMVLLLLLLLEELTLALTLGLTELWAAHRRSLHRNEPIKIRSKDKDSTKTGETRTSLI